MDGRGTVTLQAATPEETLTFSRYEVIGLASKFSSSAVCCAASGPHALLVVCIDQVELGLMPRESRDDSDAASKVGDVQLSRT